MIMIKLSKLTLRPIKTGGSDIYNLFFKTVKIRFKFQIWILLKF